MDGQTRCFINIDIIEDFSPLWTIQNSIDKENDRLFMLMLSLLVTNKTVGCCVHTDLGSRPG